MSKMKKIFSIGLLFTLVFTLVACNGKEDKAGTTDAGDEKVTLNFWGFGATGYEELVKEYMEENPNVTIKFKTSENAEHHDALFTALSAGSGAPDIAMLEVDQLDRFKKAEDRFVNLYDVGAKDVQDQYLDWKWNGGQNTAGDFLIGLPTDIGPKALYYRTDVFEAAGLPTDPAEVEALINSPEAFKDAGIQVKEKTGKPFVDSMEMAYRAYLDAANESHLNPEGELLLENEGNAVKQAYDFAVDLNAAGLVGKFEMWTPEWANAVNNGDFAVELGAGWLKGWMEGNAPDASGNFKVATLPTEFAANWGGSYLAIPAETENSQAAFDFIKWLTSPENQLSSFQTNGLFPSAPAVYEMEEFKTSEDKFFGGQVTSVVFAEAAKDINGAVYKGEKYVPVNNEILNALRNVQEGADPKEEWEAAVKRAKDLVSR
ncbi:extracellular solute-binding protein [Metabacillus litoralis]|uniref:Extracellular solute-binding protein n=1 Tax=Metabacillus litoralis TaxID=152268 RepID=A0A5C6VZN9_9BACI|nr:extracellular solute-binding protein [Metabacillus litoralis]TXC91079.1 extracellular solute-binding protein [Metabacillus litoralis]